MGFAAPIALAATIVSTGLHVAGGIASATAQRQQGRAALREAKVAAQEVRRKLTLRYGTARTHFASAGVTLDGSAADTLDDIVEDGEFEALTALYQGQKANVAARGAANRALLGTAVQALGNAGEIERLSARK